MTSATNKSQIAERNKSIERDRQSEKDIIQSLMSTIHGRRWIWNQLSATQIFIGTEDLDPYRMAFEKGRRNEGLRLLSSVLKYAPDLYIRMTNENSSATLAANEALKEPSDD